VNDHVKTQIIELAYQRPVLQCLSLLKSLTAFTVPDKTQEVGDACIATCMSARGPMSSAASLEGILIRDHCTITSHTPVKARSVLSL